MKKLHTWFMTVLVVITALILAVVFTGCADTPDTPDTPDGGDGTAPVTQSKGLDFEKIEDTETYAVVGLGNCKDAKVVVPATYKNKPVVTINSTAFAQNCGSVTEIYVPDSVKTIESGAFSGCTALQKLTIPVLKNRLNAYFNNGVPTTLKTVILTTMTEVPAYAFSGCASLEEVEFPTNATNIGWACLEGCKNIKKLTTPFVGTASVYYFDSMYQRAREAKNDFICNNTVIINNSGSYTAHLYNYWGVYVYYNGGYHFATSTFGGDFEDLIPVEITSLTITNGYITDYACWQANVKNVVISGASPNEAKGVGKLAFSSCDLLSSIMLSSEMTEIGENAFLECDALSSVTLPNGITEVSKRAFYGCDSLTTVTLPSSMQGIGDEAFSNCTSLTSIGISSSVTSIGNQAFSNCTSLISIEIPSSVTSIGDRVFYDCGNLTNVSIPSSITEFGSGVFEGCDKLSYRVHENGKYLGNSDNPCVILMGVENTSVSSFAISNHTKIIYNYAFENCSSLVSIEIPNGVSVICYGAFRYCSSLKNVTIPASVKEISMHAFYGCDSLSNAIFEKHSGWKVVSTETTRSITLSESDLSNAQTMALYLRIYRNGNYGGYRDYDWYCES